VGRRRAVLHHPEVPVSQGFLEGAMEDGPAQLGEHLPDLATDDLGATALQHPLGGWIPVCDEPLSVEPAAALGVGAEPAIQVGAGGERNGLDLHEAGDIDDVGEKGRAAPRNAPEGDARPFAVAHLSRARPDAVSMDEVTVVAGSQPVQHRVDEGNVRLVDELERVDVAAENRLGAPAEDALGGAGPHPDRAVLVGLEDCDRQRTQVLEHRAALGDRRPQRLRRHVTVRAG
jgi:hypothetical protein